MVTCRLIHAAAIELEEVPSWLVTVWASARLGSLLGKTMMRAPLILVAESSARILPRSSKVGAWVWV